MIKVLFFFSILIFIFPSCDNSYNSTKDKNSSLSDTRIDSIDKNNFVFLSFYPEMDFSSYLNQISKEIKNKNLILQSFSVKNEKADYDNMSVYNEDWGRPYKEYSYYDRTVFVLDTSNSNSLFKSRNAIDLIISLGAYSIDLKSQKPLNLEQYKMAKNLYTQKYGFIKDTILYSNQRRSYYQLDNKLIFFEKNVNSTLSIKYYSVISLSREIEAYKNKLRNDSIQREEYKKRRSKKSDILDKI